ncbi:MAG: hypothetical protein ACYTBV_18250 [Planctomycetota bacterium]|jgi:hypothetical protein
MKKKIDINKYNYIPYIHPYKKSGDSFARSTMAGVAVPEQNLNIEPESEAKGQNAMAVPGPMPYKLAICYMLDRFGRRLLHEGQPIEVCKEIPNGSVIPKWYEFVRWW